MRRRDGHRRCRRATSTSSTISTATRTAPRSCARAGPTWCARSIATISRAGCDAVQTNSFGGSPITLGEFGIADKAFDLNRRAAELAREAVAEFAGDGRTRFVFGSVGPGTRLPSLGHIAYQDARRRARRRNAPGSSPAAVDAILIETCQDPLQIKAAVNGAKRAREAAGAGHPDLRPGHGRDDRHPAGRRRHRRGGDGRSRRSTCRSSGSTARPGRARWPSTSNGSATTGRGTISVQPNAGLPELISGHTHYPLTPEGAGAMARALRPRGRGQHHRRLLRHRGRAHRRARPDAAAASAATGRGRCRRRARRVWIPSVASLYSQVPLRQENAYLSIGERCNANGSRAFRRLQEAGDWDGCVEMGREQVKEGSHTLDLCTAFVGRDEIAEMSEIGHPHARRGQRAPGHRFDRIPGARSRAEALWRQADHQLDQFRGWRGGRRQAPQAGAALRRRGHRADDRRKRHGQGGRPQAAPRRAALRFRLQPARAAAERSAVRPADLHDLHRQRGRPQARPQHLDAIAQIARADARMPDHPRPLQHLVRPQPAGAAGAELGLSRPRAAPRPDRRDRAFLEDPAAAPHPGGGGAGRRGSDLRPPPRRLRPAAGLHGAVRGPHGREGGEEGPAGKARGAARAAHRRRRPARSRSRSRPGDGDATSRSTSSTTSCSSA